MSVLLLAIKYRANELAWARSSPTCPSAQLQCGQAEHAGLTKPAIDLKPVISWQVAGTITLSWQHAYRLKPRSRVPILAFLC